MLAISKHFAKTLLRLDLIPLRTFAKSLPTSDFARNLSTINSRNKSKSTSKPPSKFAQKVSKDSTQRANKVLGGKKKHFENVLKESVDMVRGNTENMESCGELVGRAQAASSLPGEAERKKTLQEIEEKMVLKFNELTTRELVEAIEAFGKAGVTPDKLLMILDENPILVRKEEAFKLLSSFVQLRYENAKLIGFLIEQLAMASPKFSRQDIIRTLRILVDIKEHCVTKKMESDIMSNAKFYLIALASTFLG